MARKYRLYAWDSNTVIHFVQGNPKYPTAFRDIFEEIDRGEARIVCSVLVKVEALSGKHRKPEEKQHLELFFTHPNIHFDIVSDAVAMETARIREYCFASLKKTKNPKCEDAIHLANAILRKAHSLHTIDSGLTALNGKLEWTNTRIAPPAPVNPSLFSQGDK